MNNYNTIADKDCKFGWNDVEEKPLGKRLEDDRYILYAGYEERKLFVVELASGDEEQYYGSLDENGTLCNEWGDDVGWNWEDISAWSHIPSYLSNA